MLAKYCLIRLHKVLDKITRSQMKEKECAMDIALLRLGHVPYVVTNNRKMAVWSDVKEVLLWCPDPECSVVLNALKMMLGYPASEAAIHPCSQLEQLLFLKHFMFITHGTLLVDVDSVRDAAKLAVLFNIVKQKHTKSKDPVVHNCTKMLQILTQKYANTTFKIRLNSAHSKRFLPAVRRMVKTVSATVMPKVNLTSQQRCLRPCEIPATRTSPHSTDNTREVETAVGGKPEGSSSRTLVPMVLLSLLYPGSEKFLDEVVRLYVLGRCREGNIHSICHCTVEEGIQLTRFLASQNGYEMSWLCLTSASLMISWSEFWTGLERMCRGTIVSISSDVCVVTLNCQTTEETRKGKVMPRWSMPTQLSPPLSPITDITENVQSRSTNGPLIRLSQESQNGQFSEKAYNLLVYGKINAPEIKGMLLEKLPLSEGPNETVDTDGDRITEASVTDEDKVIKATETDKYGVTEASEMDNEPDAKASGTNKYGNEDKPTTQKESKKLSEVGKGDRKHLKNQGKKKLKNTNDNKTFENQRNRDARSSKTDGKSVRLKLPKMKRQIFKKAKVTDKDATEEGYSGSGIRSRLRSNCQEKTILEEGKRIDVGKIDTNNSAVKNSLSSKIARTGSGDTNSAETKLVELSESSTATSDEVCVASSIETKVPVSHCVGIKIELPLSEVSQYDLASMAHTEMEGIHVSITPKKAQDIQGENVPEMFPRDNPLFNVQKIPKKKVESTQAIRAERQMLKISSAQLNDEIPSTLRCANNISDASERCSLDAERGFSYQQTEWAEEVNQKRNSDCHNEENSVKAYKPRFKILTPKQLELTSPMLRGPDPNAVQDSKKIPYKPVKNQEHSSSKKQAETPRHSLKNECVFHMLEGTQIYSDSTLRESRSGRLSAGTSKDSPHDSVQELPLTSDSPSQTGVLHEEIVKTLQRQAVNSMCLGSGNQQKRENLLAEGRTMKAFDKTKDLNSSEFLKERITMWKDQVEQSLHLTSPGRLSKSAGFVRKQSVYAQRPKSSIYSSKTPDFYHGCPSIKTALHAVCSRERASTEVFNKRNSFHASPKEAFVVHAEKSLETDKADNFRQNDNNYSLSSSDIMDSATAAQTPKERDKTSLENQCDTQNYGSSSSTTPDIYDEFARKKKPKPPRPDGVQIKSKPGTTPVATSISQPFLRTQAQATVKISTKPNYHTVGYISNVKTSDQYKGPSNINQGSKQTYQHTDTSKSQNLPCSSMTRIMNTLLPEQSYKSSNSFCVGYQAMKTEKNENQSFCKEDEKRSFVPNFCKVSSDSQSTQLSQTNPTRVQSFPSVHCMTRTSGHWHNPYIESHQGQENQHSTENTCKQTERCSTRGIKRFVAEKMPFYTQHKMTSGKLESLENVDSALDTNPICSFSSESTNQLKSSSSNNFQSDRDTACAKNESTTCKQYLRSKSASGCIKPSKQEMIIPKPIQDLAKEKMLSKVNAQLYYKVPDDEKFYPVSENMMIPMHAQFFAQANLIENNEMLPRTKSVPTIKHTHTFHENANRMKQSLNMLEIPEEINEINSKHMGIENILCEIRENEHSGTDISEEEALSDTTFDSIIKASENFIDKSKQIKHIISETKLALKKETDEEIDKKLENQLPHTDMGHSEQVDKDCSISNKVDSQKVIVPSLGLVVERKKASTKKSFKEVIEEKRAEKRRVQQELSEKKFWNSAYSKKGAQSHSTQADKSCTQVNKIESDKNAVKFYNKSCRQDKEITEQSISIDKVEVKHPEKTINSKFVITSQPRPKTCVAYRKGRASKYEPSVGNRTKKDFGTFNARHYSDCAMKQNQDRNGYTNSTEYQQPAKPVTIFPRSRNSKCRQQKEADDCTNKILTALRRLSIEKSPKKDGQESLRKEARKRKLRSRVVNQTSGTSTKTAAVKCNEHKHVDADTKSDTCVVKDHSENEKEKANNNTHMIDTALNTYPECSFSAESTSQLKSSSNHFQPDRDTACAKNENTISKQYLRSKSALSDNCIEKIPVVISRRNDCVEHIPESSEDKEFCKYYTSDQEENADKQKQTDLLFQPSDIQVPYFRFIPTTCKDEIHTNKNTKQGDETFITQYGTRALTSFDSTSVAHTSPSSICVDKEKYLGIPYFQEANSNMNNAEPIFPGLNSETATGYCLNQGTLQLGDASTEKHCELMDDMNSCVVDANGRGYLDHLPVVSITEDDIVKNENLQYFKFANENCHLIEILERTSAENDTSNYAKCMESKMRIGEEILINDCYVHSGVLGTEYTEMLPGSGLDTNWLNTTFRKDTECSPGDGYTFTSVDKQKTVEKKREQEQDQIHDRRFTYVEYDIPEALQQQGDERLFETINVISDRRNVSETIEKEPSDPVEITSAPADGMYQYVYDTVPILNLNAPITANNEDIGKFPTSFYQSDIPETLKHCKDQDICENATSAEHADNHVSEYTASLINEDWDHYYQLESPHDTFEMPGVSTQTLNFEGNSSNDSNNCEIFLDETECGQEVCIGDKEMSDKNIQDLENGIGDSYENGSVCGTLSRRNNSSEICSGRNPKNGGQNDSNNTEETDITSKDDQLKKIFDKQTHGKRFGCLLSQESSNIPEVKEIKTTKNKKKRQKHKNKQTTRKTKTEFSTEQERYSPSESEMEAYFTEIKKRTGIDDSDIAGENGKSPQNTSKGSFYTDANSDDSLPDIQRPLSREALCSSDDINENSRESFSIKDDDHDKSVYTKTVPHNDEAQADDDDDDDDDDNEGDRDYNPEEDIDDLENSSESDHETVEEFAKSSSKRKKKLENVTKKEVYDCSNEFINKKRHGISLDNIRKRFQKKYNIKNSSTILFSWKQKPLNEKAAEDAQHKTVGMNVGQNTCSKNIDKRKKSIVREDKREKSIVREFCSKKKETSNVHLGKNGPAKQQTLEKNDLADEGCFETNKNKKCDVREGKQGHETVKSESNSLADRSRKKSKRVHKNVTSDGGENSEDETKSIAAEGFIKTQKLYYEILRKSSLSALKDDAQEHCEERVKEACVDDLSEVIEAVPVHGERVITKALSDAEKALEGTGSLEDILNADDDEGTVIEDLINQCSYQMIEDEDHVQLGGIAYFKDFALPFVYINGYKFTPLKEALTIFTPACCISACTIPRTVLQKCKVLVKSLSTWEQVYKLELIKMKKGPPIMTGDVLVKLDTLLVQLPELIEQIVEQHNGTKLKRSKKCNVIGYKTLI